MRTTITLDPDVALLVEREMKEKRLKFKDAVNDALRRQLSRGGGSGTGFSVPTFKTGTPLVDLAYANHIAVELEDEATLRKLAEGR